MRFILISIALWTATFFPVSAHAQDQVLADIAAANELYLDEPSSTHRTAVLAALAAYDGPPTVSTVSAHLTVMMRDAATQDYDLIAESADAATLHLAPIFDLLPKPYLEARFLRSIATFEARQAREALLEMAHIQGMTREISAEDGSWPDWAKRLHYQAEAWNRYIVRTLKRDKTAASEAEQILANYATRAAIVDETGLPLCAGEISARRRISYPSRAAQRGISGEVILEFDIAANGQAESAEIIAAVPANAFEAESLEWIEGVSFRPDSADQVGVTCRLERTGIIYPLSFSLN